MAKSTTKAAPRPRGPVTSQARALTSADMLPSPARRSAARHDPFFQPRPVPGRYGALGAALVEGEAALLGQLEQALALRAFARYLEEDPGEDAEGEEGALDHHDRAGGALVGDRRDAPEVLPFPVDRIEDRVRPHQHVAEDRAGEADGDHVAHLPGG